MAARKNEVNMVCTRDANDACSNVFQNRKLAPNKCCDMSPSDVRVRGTETVRPATTVESTVATTAAACVQT